MMKDEKFEKWLASFDIPGPSIAAKQSCAVTVKKAIKPQESNNAISVIDLLKIQYDYLQKEKIISLFVLMAVIESVLLFIMLSDSGKDVLYSGFVLNTSSASLYIIPLIISLYRSSGSKMNELEAACKYSLPQMVVSRLLLNGILAFGTILLLWALTGTATYDFTVSRLYVALISYNITLILFLLSGRKSMLKGIAGSFLWILFSGMFLGLENNFYYFYHMSNAALFVGLFISGITLLYVTLKYMKATSFEQEETRWNLSLTD